MRTLLLIIAIIISHSPFSFAQSIKSQEAAPINEHLIEVNQQWKGKTLSQKEVSFKDETQRIQFHLSKVLEYLEEADLSGLNNRQKENRQSTIKYLRKYKERALFPKNEVLPIRNPIFKDHHQTACAVAHLMEQTGHQDVVNLIQRESNFSFIEKLSIAYPQVNDWANEQGFTLGELALIQPGYPPAHRDYFPIGNGGPVEGKINVMKSNHVDGHMFLAGQFSEIDGVEAQNIIAWDGEDWIDLGSPIIGEIHDVAFTPGSNSRLFVVGNFYLEDNPELQNIAMYYEGEWTGLQSGDMEGIVNTVHYNNVQLYIGGDFQKLDGEPISYLARRIIQDIENSSFTNDYEFWSNGSTQVVENGFSVNGPVNVITQVEEKILIAGLFEQTAPGVDSEYITQHDVNNIAFWSNDWVVQMNQPFNEIEEAAYLDNKLYLSDIVEREDGTKVPRAHVLAAGFWNQVEYGTFDDTDEIDHRIFGFFGHDDSVFAFGNINLPDTLLAFVPNAGFMEFPFIGDNGIIFNGTVRAAESLGERLYFAGDFIHPEGDGLVSADLQTGGGNATHDLGFNAEIEIFTSEKVLQINYENLQDKVNFSLYNTSGQLIENFDLTKGNASIQRNLSALSDGIYIYQIHDGKKMYSSKLSVF